MDYILDINFNPKFEKKNFSTFYKLVGFKIKKKMKIFTCLPALLLCRFIIRRCIVWFLPFSLESTNALETAIP